MNRKIYTYFAMAIILLAGVLAYSAGWDDSAIVDEDPHIGAGISYVTQKDMRLNPEHPPLVKDLSALPLLLIHNLKIPTGVSSWTNDVNGQWDFGRAFLFQSGNNADTILRLARIAPVLILMLLGWFVFMWARKLGGLKTGFIALILYAFSPIILAHGHYVATDVPAAAGMFIATYFFIRYLKDPAKKNLIIAGIAFGLAQLTKFSTALLVPYFAVLTIVYLWVRLALNKERGRSAVKRYIGGPFLLGFVGLTVIYLLYVYHVWNYPQTRQVKDIVFILTSFPNQAITHLVSSMAGITFLRPLAQYFLGLAMVFQRATGGNTTFFMGEVSAAGWSSYFPIVYLIKIPLAVHLLGILALLTGVTILIKKFKAGLPVGGFFKGLAKITEDYFTELSFVFFIAVYWLVSLNSNLNIGVRHLTPTLPFVFVLTALGINALIKPPKSAIKKSIVALLLFWVILAGILVWPAYLTYFNELSYLRGGGANWVVDSNLDWGQDLKRLNAFVAQNNIKEVAVDYFGWTPPDYYIKQARVIPWSAGKGQPHGWFAVSATYKQQACARPAPNFNQDTTGYCFLNAYKPRAVIGGGSIYVYNLP